MMNKNLPWNDIKVPQNELSVRQIRECEKLQLYWGKDSQGRCLFIFEIEADGLDIFSKNVVPVHGIHIDLRFLKTTGNQSLILTLEKHVDQDLFYSLCETLIQSLHDISEPLIGLSVALSQIKRWKAFMAGGKGKVLSAEEIRGLFSELSFLQQMLEETHSEYLACDSWQGPEALHQDFIFSNTAVEIKSISGRERNTIKISSENQLESCNENLFIKVFRLVNMPESKRAISLNDLIENIENSLNDSEAIELFCNKIAKAGYVKLRAYDVPRFIIADEQTYSVKDDFPRLVRSKLPLDILNVNYEIKLETIKSYMCLKKDIWSK